MAINTNTKRMIKRTLSLIMALALVLSLGITSAFAAPQGHGGIFNFNLTQASVVCSGGGSGTCTPNGNNGFTLSGYRSTDKVTFTVTANDGYVLVYASYDAKTGEAGVNITGNKIEFPYTMNEDKGTITHTVVAEKPNVEVTITSDHAGDVEADEKVTLTVTFTLKDSGYLGNCQAAVSEAEVQIGSETYKVRLQPSSNGKTWTGTVEYTVKETDIGTTVEASVSAKVHYTGECEVKADAGTAGKIDINTTGDATSTTEFHVTKRTYTVTYEDGVPDEEVFKDDVYTVDEGEPTPNFKDGTPTRDGYTFTGWNPKVEETVTKNATYTAQWEPIEYTVTYKDGADGNVFKDEVHSAHKGETTPKFNGTPTRDGYVFNGWSPAVAETVTKDMTYTATWGEDKNNNGKDDSTEERYTLTYNANGGDGAPVDTTEYLSGTTATVSQNGPSTPPEEDCLFVGWSEAQMNTLTAANKGETVTTVSGEITMNSDKTLYAVWAEDKNHNNTPDYQEGAYKLTYDGNGTDVNVPTDEAAYLPGTEVTLSDGEPTRTGYVFLGWTETATAPVPHEGPKLDNNIIITEVVMDNNKTVYAAWAVDANGDGTADVDQIIVTYTVVNGTWEDQNETTVTEYLTKDANGSATLGDTIPTGVPAENYDTVGSWGENTPAADTVVTGDTTYTLTYSQSETEPGGGDEGGDEGGDPDPTDPGDNGPTDPGDTDPTDPGDNGPTDPGNTDPTDPGDTDPTDPTDPDITDIPDDEPPLSDEPVEIPDDEPPLSDEPVEIPDEEPPLSEEPIEIPDEEPPLSELPDEDVPLADVPKTGDNSKNIFWMSAMAVSAAGLAYVTVTTRKKNEGELSEEDDK